MTALMTASPRVGRRGFLQGMAASAASLTIGFHLPAKAAGPAAATDGALVNAWLRIGPDGFVTVLSNVSELGQGTSSAIAQVLADELDLDWSRVGTAHAPVEAPYFNPLIQQYAVWGSTGMSTQFEALRKVGAQARAMLVQAAAARWTVAPESCATRDGAVVHDASGRSLGYGDLAVEAAKLTPPAEPALKPKEQWRYIGKGMPRLDLPAKVDGSAVFGVDVALEGLRVATIRQAPVFGGRLLSVDEGPALAVKGVEKVVRLPDAVAVVARGYWQAHKGIEALSPVWDTGDNPKLDSAGVSARLHAALEAGEAKTFPRRDQDPAAQEAATKQALDTAATRFTRTYEAPFLHHATLEPMNGTARMTADGGVELWLPTQNQSQGRLAIAAALGIPAEKVTIHTTLIGGGFGRRIEVDYGVQAALIAKAAGVPVKLIWSREEDTGHGFYRPAAVARVTAGLDADRTLKGMVFEAAAPGLFPYSELGKVERNRTMPVEFTGLMYALRLPYAVGAYRAAYARTDVGVRCGFWRSVGDSQNAFFVESFIDELAVEAGADPVDYRRRLLAQAPRELGVLDAVAAASGWGAALPKGVHRGIALSRSNGSSSAMVIEIGVDGTAVTLRKVWFAIDCGLCVNPDSVKRQIEGGVIFGLTAAMTGKITVAGGAVEQGNFHDVPLMTMAGAPAFAVMVLETGGRMGGVGEEGVAAAAPALANALFRATGNRYRSLPLIDHGFTFAG